MIINRLKKAQIQRKMEWNIETIVMIAVNDLEIN